MVRRAARQFQDDAHLDAAPPVKRADQRVGAAGAAQASEGAGGCVLHVVVGAAEKASQPGHRLLYPKRACQLRTTNAQAVVAGSEAVHDLPENAAVRDLVAKSSEHRAAGRHGPQRKNEHLRGAVLVALQ